MIRSDTDLLCYGEAKVKDVLVGRDSAIIGLILPIFFVFGTDIAAICGNL
jgi:hypothetical protein